MSSAAAASQACPHTYNARRTTRSKHWAGRAEEAQRTPADRGHQLFQQHKPPLWSLAGNPQAAQAAGPCLAALCRPASPTAAAVHGTGSWSQRRRPPGRAPPRCWLRSPAAVSHGPSPASALCGSGSSWPAPYVGKADGQPKKAKKRVEKEVRKRASKRGERSKRGKRETTTPAG